VVFIATDKNLRGRLAMPCPCKTRKQRAKKRGPACDAFECMQTPMHGANWCAAHDAELRQLLASMVQENNPLERGRLSFRLAYMLQLVGGDS
jgi:hypothetical protein